MLTIRTINRLAMMIQDLVVNSVIDLESTVNARKNNCDLKFKKIGIHYEKNNST